MNNGPMVAVVDDEASICRALTRLLRTADYRVEAFSSATVFLEWLTEHKVDCAVVDLQMPEMTGADLQQQLLRLDDPPAVIIITAHDEPRARERCLALGAVRYLRKLIARDVLIEAIEEALDTGRRANRPTGGR